MSVESIITDVESSLVRLIRYGLGARKQVTNLTTLAAQPKLDGLRYVPASGVWEWQPFSSATPDGSTVVASTQQSRGRWVKLSTSWTYGAGGQNLGSKTTGYLLTVEEFDSEDVAEVVERIKDATPSVLVQWAGSNPQSIANPRGYFYRDDLAFVLLIVSSNLRGVAAATQGSALPTEAAADPGVHAIVGQLRRLICGVSPVFGVDGVERLEIGPVSRIFEADDRRLYVYSMLVTARCSWSVEDEDLVDFTLQAQPVLVDDYPLPGFDKANFIASGGDFAEGLGDGLDRTITAVVAVVGGVSVSAAELAHTFTASKDTYRDLSADGWDFVEVDVGTDPPAPAAGSLRVAVTRTDETGVVSDQALCSFAVPFGEPLSIG